MMTITVKLDIPLPVPSTVVTLPCSAMILSNSWGYFHVKHDPGWQSKSRENVRISYSSGTILYSVHSFGYIHAHFLQGREMDMQFWKQLQLVLFSGNFL
jgi:hypothetical protein